MKVYLSYSEGVRALVISLILLFLVLSIVILIMDIIKRRKFSIIAADFILIVIMFILPFELELSDRLVRAGKNLKGFSLFVSELPLWVYVVAFCITVVYFAIRLSALRRAKRVQITYDSVREATDNLPAGICYAHSTGRLMFANRAMYKFYDSLCGEFLNDAKPLWDCGENIMLDNGDVWTVKSEVISFGDLNIIETIAFDTTKLYNMRDELYERNRALKLQQERLSKLLTNIGIIQREEEVLLSKVRIHDHFGRCVIATRRFLVSDGNDISQEEIIEMWDTAVKLLEASMYDKEISDNDAVSDLLEAADVLGCKIIIDGDVPEKQELSYLIVSLIRVAVTNAYEYAKATELYANISRDDRYVICEISDNGQIKADFIREGGGLLGIRKSIERCGGEFVVKCDDGVKLMAKIPVEDGVI